MSLMLMHAKNPMQGNGSPTPIPNPKQAIASTMQKLTDQITVRLHPELRAAMQEIEARHRIGAAEFVRGLVEAGVEMYRRRGAFGFPVEVMPAKLTARRR